MLVLLLIAAPLGTGLIINRFIETESRSVGMVYLSGFLILLSVFQLIAVPIVFTDPWGFESIVKIFTVLMTILTAVGIVQSLHMWRREGKIAERKRLEKKNNWVLRIQWLIVFFLIGFQLVMAVTHASFDGDDAYYVVQSVITEETNTLYRILPYTGLSSSLDMRHSMAVFPIWIAYISRMSGIHATIVSHTILPVILISLTYLIYYEIGKKLFRDKKEQQAVYMIFVCMLQIFGNVSIYHTSTFFLMRTWQGKSMLANVVIPAVFLVLLWIFDVEPERRGKQAGLWFLLFLINIVAAMMSTASVFLNAVLLGVMALVLWYQTKNLKIVFKMAGCCIPCVGYALLYLLL